MCDVGLWDGDGSCCWECCECDLYRVCCEGDGDGYGYGDDYWEGEGEDLSGMVVLFFFMSPGSLQSNVFEFGAGLKSKDRKRCVFFFWNRGLADPLKREYVHSYLV